MTFNIKKTFTLPELNDRVANCLYMVKPPESNVFEFHWSNESKNIISGLTESHIQTLITQATADLSSLYYAATIVDRDALVFNANSLVLVIDASDDPTVVSGTAMYFYLASNSSFIKIAEFESMDVSLSWSALTDKPSSTVIQIDDAVTKRHSHVNKDVLDLLTESSTGNLLYNAKNLLDYEIVGVLPTENLELNKFYIIKSLATGYLEFAYVTEELDHITVTVHKSLLDSDVEFLIDERIALGTLNQIAVSNGLTWVGADLNDLLNTRIENGTTNQVATFNGTKWVGGNIPYDLSFAASDETTALTVGLDKVTLRVARTFNLTNVKASLTTAQTSGVTLTLNVKKDGVSIFTTPLTFNNTSKTTTNAVVSMVLTSPSIVFNEDAEITIDISQIGDGTAKGLKIYLLGHL